MESFFKYITSHSPALNGKAVTVTEGPHIGERAIVSGKNCIWRSADGGFFTGHEKELVEIDKNGQTQIDGTKIFCEGISYDKKMVICGGGHVGIAVAKLALMTEFDVTVLEDRPKFAETARKIGVSHVLCDSFEAGLEQIPGDADTYFVIVTRGHRFDTLCLETILTKPHAYIGMMGSRVRVAKLLKSLEEKGISGKLLETVHTPIGLRIEAETPEEIAISILAEIIQTKNQEKRTGGYSEIILEGIKQADRLRLQKVLATIVERRGSAPRREGTKMLIFEDGTCVETIGGGCVEAEVIRQALLMMREKQPRAKRIHIDMTGRMAEEEGMVCGGVVDILLEIV